MADDDDKPAGFKSSAVFARMASNLKANPGLLKKVNGTFLFNVTGGADSAQVLWFCDATVGAEGGGSVKVVSESPTKSDCTITISDTDLVALASGKLNAMSAYMSGKLKLRGKSALAQKLGELLKGPPRSKL
mmetsp:Transcript_13865/g.35762  ORF Transcript_13865/g.35762 Transcript_13865/m.35762 type:complete len:132 (-) Transcript_13865:179-574(-)